MKHLLNSDLKENVNSDLKENIPSQVVSELFSLDNNKSVEDTINFWELDKFSIKRASVWESISINLRLELKISSKKTMLIYSDNLEIYAVDLDMLENYYVKSEILFCKFLNGDKISLKFKKLEFSFEFLGFLVKERSQKIVQEEFPLVISTETLKLEKIINFQKKLSGSKEFLEKIKFLKQEPKWESVLKKILERKEPERNFKITKVTQENSKKKIPVKAYCFCRKPDDFSLMVECSNQNCKIGWFHAKCVFKDLDGKSVKDIDRNDWYCVNCIKIAVGK